MKKLAEQLPRVSPHWVGDGFPVRSMFSYNDRADVWSPFLLLDYAGPAEFPPANRPRGVGEHPHRGFETVTIVYQGELEHRDSGGNHGKIAAGDVQWMTAASGVVHEEFHSRDFTKHGGTLEMVQLWVNLPAAEKMSAPRYQEIHAADIPNVDLPGGAGAARVIAGELFGARGPARTVTPIVVCDLSLRPGRCELPAPEGFTTLLVVHAGIVVPPEGQSAEAVSLLRFEREGSGIAIESAGDVRGLLLCGAPINEPVVGQGPFVMNTREEIRQAILDYQNGRMGRLG